LEADSLIFDLDGTLWDASASCVMAWNKALEKKGIKDFVVTEPMAHTFAGKTMDEIFSRYFAFLPEDQYQNMAMAYAEEEKWYMKTFGGKLYPNVKPLLNKLAEKYALFIVSNCLSGYIENFLDQHQLGPLFTDHECIGNSGKPKVENIGSIIKRNQLKCPVYIGDTNGDHAAAAKNSISFIYAEYGFGNVTNHEYSIKEFAELEKMVMLM
jgi:phosphoglycolate phosphatase